MAESWLDYLGEFLSEKVPGVAGITEGIAGHQKDQQLLEQALTYIEQRGWLTDEAMQDLRDHSRFAMGPVQDAYMKYTDRIRGGPEASAIYSSFHKHIFTKAGKYGDNYKALANSLLHEYGHVLDFKSGQELKVLPFLLGRQIGTYPASHGKPGGNITPYAETHPVENFAEIFEAIAKFGSPWGNTQPVSNIGDLVQRHIQPWMVPIFEKVIQNYNKPVPSWWSDAWWSDEPPYASDPAAGPRAAYPQEGRPEGTQLFHEAYREFFGY
tara:strand:+ start:743 stop:1546 length:804 start_codon:yes stop_codon:yes gene_type:complete